MTDSERLAQFWLDLANVRDKIQNRIIPVAEYLMDESLAELVQTLDLTYDAINRHLDGHRLMVTKREV